MNAMPRSASMVLAGEVGFVPVGIRWLQMYEWFWSYKSET